MMEDGISDACAKGVVVIISTRTPGGRVLDVYGYPGSVTDSCKRGAIMGGEISAAKARLKLILALSENPRKFLTNSQFPPQNQPFFLYLFKVASRANSGGSFFE